MKNLKNLSLLLLVTAVALVGAWYAIDLRRSDEATAATNGLLYPDLESRINDVARLQVRKSEDTFTVARVDGTWGIEECSGYPAKTEKIKETIWRIAELDIEAVKTKLPSKYAQLGVEGLDAPDSTSSEVVLWNEAGEELAAVIVGRTDYRRGGQSVYVRKLGEEQSYACAGRTDLRTDVRTWADVIITRIPTTRMKSTTIVHPDGDRVQLERIPGDGDRFRVVNLPDGRTEKYEGVGSSVAGTLAALELEDVRTLAEMPFDTGDETIATYRTLDGVTYVVRSREDQDQTWVHLAARAEEPVGPPLVIPPAPEGEDGAGAGAEEEDAAPGESAVDPVDQAFLAAAREADAFNARFGAWVFAVSSYKADNLRKRMEDLLAEEATDETAGEIPFELPTDLLEGLDIPPLPLPDDDGTPHPETAEGETPVASPPVDPPVDPPDDGGND